MKSTYLNVAKVEKNTALSPVISAGGQEKVNWAVIYEISLKKNLGRLGCFYLLFPFYRDKKNNRNENVIWERIGNCGRMGGNEYLVNTLIERELVWK